MPEIFVCYSRDDSVIMESVVENLRRLGFNLWVDTEHLTPGTPDWKKAIDTVLQRCDAVLAFLSPAAIDSHWCQIEISRAQTFEKPIYPILVAGNHRTAVPIDLEKAQYADMRGRADRNASLKQLIQALSKDLNYSVPDHNLQSVDKKPVVTISETALYTEGKIIAINIGGNVSGGVTVAGGNVIYHDQPSESPGVVTEAPEPVPSQPAPKPKPSTPHHTSILDILPGPFEWCKIPAGQVEIEEQHFDVQSFHMAKYPITYEQFQMFVYASDGFINDQWWHVLAKHKLENQFFTHTANLPRENISWYDAIAYCHWLSNRVDYEVRLPTEWEWQWAAQGEDGRLYPWGNEYIEGYANVNETFNSINGSTYLKATTPVGSYPMGASPYGVLDMAGNVSEWCLNDHSSLNITIHRLHVCKVLRGGSWNRSNNYARVDYRDKNYPTHRLKYNGFRVCAPLLP